MSAIIDAIRENLRQISIVFEPTEPAFAADRRKTGDARELTVKEFLESFFPRTYTVRRGLIYSMDGHSQEIDCVLLAPNHPPLVTPVRDVIIAEGVHAAVEVKPDISTLTEGSEFRRGLKQIQSVKQLQREVQYMPTNEVAIDHRIPAAIFAAKSRPLADLVDYMVKLVVAGELKPHELPDLIVTLDKGVLFHSASVPTSILRRVFGAENAKGQRAFLAFGPEQNSLALFLLLLYSLTPPEPHLAEPVLKRYLEFGAPNMMYEY